MNVKDYFIGVIRKVKQWLQSLSFRTGVIVLLCCIPFYILSFAQMLLPISVTAKGVLWTVLFGLAKTCQYGGLTILGVEGYKRLKNKFRKKIVPNETKITERQIKATDAGNNALKTLYETAFPPEEQIPWDDLMVLVEKIPLNFTAYYEGETLMGLFIVYPRKSFNWFWYFAVPEELRGKGVGQQILSSVIEKYKDSTNILDIESPEQECDNQAVRRRRHAFYLRNGFRDTGIGRSYGGVDYTIIMMGDGTFTMHDYDEIVAELRSYWTNMPNPEEEKY